jgi:hypothetical protein
VLRVDAQLINISHPPVITTGMEMQPRADVRARKYLVESNCFSPLATGSVKEPSPIHASSLVMLDGREPRKVQNACPRTCHLRHIMVHSKNRGHAGLVGKRNISMSRGRVGIAS